MMTVILPHPRNHLGSFLHLLMCFYTLLFIFWSFSSCYIPIDSMWHGLHLLDGVLCALCTRRPSFASCSSAFLYLTIG